VNVPDGFHALDSNLPKARCDKLELVQFCSLLDVIHDQSMRGKAVTKDAELVLWQVSASRMIVSATKMTFCSLQMKTFEVRPDIATLK
jgi:hypothetical protein